MSESDSNSGNNSSSKKEDSEMKRKFYEISMNTSTKFLRSKWNGSTNKTNNYQSDIAEGLLIQKIPRTKKIESTPTKKRNEDTVQNIDKIDTKMSKWTLPYEIASSNSMNNKGICFSLSEKMKYDRLDSVISSNFIGRMVAIKRNGEENIKIGTIKKFKSSKVVSIQIGEEDNNSIIIDMKKSNDDIIVYLIEFAFYSKKNAALAVIVSNFITKEILITKNDKDNVVYSGFLLPNTFTLSQGKIITLSPSFFSSTIPSSYLSSISSIPPNQVPISNITLCYTINNVYSSFLRSIEYLSIGSSSLPKYILFEISYKDNLYLLLSHNTHYNTFLLRNFMTNQLEWMTFDNTERIDVNLMKGPAMLVSVQKPRSNFWTQTTFKNTKAISIYDNHDYETNISIRKRINNYNVLSLVECSKCMYSIGNYDYYICYSCSKVFHANCLDKAMKDAILINGTFSCDDCRPCFNCKGNSNLDKVTCVQCGKAYHLSCLLPQIRSVYSDIDNDHYRCEHCVKCRQCGIDVYQINNGNKFNSKCDMCIECETKRNKKEYCPICDQLWMANDNLIECKCKYSYHVKCDRILSTVGTSKKKYHCPNCRIKKKIKFLENFIKSFIALDENLFFIEPVDTKAFPNYAKVIKKPMCFHMIEDKIKREDFPYLKDMKEFFDDIYLISKNAIIYNKPNDFIYKVAEQLKADCEKILNENFNYLYQMSFEYYLFDYADIDDKKKNQSIEAMLQCVSALLKSKFSKELLERMGNEHIQSKINEYEIKWSMLNEFGLNSFNQSSNNIKIRIDEDLSKTITMNNNIKHQKKNNDIMLELDLHNSNFEVNRKSTRMLSSSSLHNNAKMEINENKIDNSNISLKEEENDVIKDYEHIKQNDKRIAYLYPNKFRDYSIKKNDTQAYVDFISSFVNKKEDKRNLKRKPQQNNKVYYDEDVNSDKRSDSSDYEMINKIKKKTKRKMTESSYNDNALMNSNSKKKKKISICQQNTNVVPSSTIEKNIETITSSPCHISFSSTSLLFCPCCYLCGSFDDVSSFIMCANCNEAYHFYCISPLLDIEAIRKSKWKCDKCKTCEICDESNNMLLCTKCNAGYHSKCLRYPINANVDFKCEKCFTCFSCGTDKYHNANFPLKKEKDYSFFTRHFTYCYQCGLKAFNNSLCGKCDCSDFKNYKKKLFFIDSKTSFSTLKGKLDDEDILMIKCEQCMKWYHSKCIGFDMFSIEAYYNKFDTFSCLDCALIEKYNTKYSEIAYISYLEVLRTSFKLMCLSKMTMILLKNYQLSSSVKLHTKLIKMFLKENYENILKNKNVTMLIEMIKLDVYLLREKNKNENEAKMKIDEETNDDMLIDKYEDEIIAEGRKEIQKKGIMNHKQIEKIRIKYEIETNKKNALKKKINFLIDNNHHRKSFRNKSLDLSIINNIKDINSLIYKINITKLKQQPQIVNSQTTAQIQNSIKQQEMNSNHSLENIENYLKKRDANYINTYLIKNYFKNQIVTSTNKKEFPNNIVSFYDFDIDSYFSSSQSDIFTEIYRTISSMKTQSSELSYQKTINNFLLRVIFSSITFLRTTLLKWLLTQLTNDNSFIVSPPSLLSSCPISDIILQDDTTLSDEDIFKYIDAIDPIIESPNSNQRCEFCLRRGQRSRSGRLIHIKNDLWCHVNCVYWSKGVSESKGILCGVNSIINKLSQFKCLLCKKPGATVVCNVPKCGRPFHFICALAKGCTFTNDNNVYCNRCTHSQKDDTDAVLYNNTRKLYQIEKKNDSAKFCIGLYNRYGSSSVMKFIQVNSKDRSYENVEINVLKCIKDKVIMLILVEGAVIVKSFDIREKEDIDKIEDVINRAKLNNCFVRSYNEEIDKIISNENNDIIKVNLDTILSLVYCPNKQTRSECIVSMLKSLQTSINEFYPSSLLINTSQEQSQDIIQTFFNFPYSLSSIFANNSEAYLSHIISEKQPETLLTLKDSLSPQSIRIPMNMNTPLQSINHESKISTENLSIASSSVVNKSKRATGNSSKSKLENFVSIMKAKNKVSDIDDNVKLQYTVCFKFVNYIESHQQFLTGRRQTGDVEMKDVNATKKSKSKQTYKNLNQSSSSVIEYNLPLPMKYRNYKMQGTRVAIGPSRIHRNGLFAMDNFQPGEIVIEYVGEVITNKIADFREKEYNLRGFGDCYMFRVDADKIIDATKYGNLARFINHSCDPNCTAQSNEINGRKHILLYAKKYIKLGEEITYDYNFESETEKIQCRCGAPNCQGRLN